MKKYERKLKKAIEITGELSRKPMTLVTGSVKIYMKKAIAAENLSVKLVSNPQGFNFAGTGSECVAAKKLEQRYIGFELNPDYIRIAEKRLAEIQV